LEIRSVRTPGEAAAHVHVTPTKLTGTVLRDLPLGELIQKWRTLESAMLQRRAYKLEGKSREKAQTMADEWAKRPRRGRPSKGLDFYADVARVYLEAMNRGESPVTAVQHWHRRAERADSYPSKSAATKWVYRARKLGLLPPAS
jgi:hypothetical protein